MSLVNRHVSRVVLCSPDGVSLDGDSPDHIMWVYEQAQRRADEYGIQGVTYRLTQGLVICMANNCITECVGWGLTYV